MDNIFWFFVGVLITLGFIFVSILIVEWIEGFSMLNETIYIIGNDFWWYQDTTGVNLEASELVLEGVLQDELETAYEGVPIFVERYPNRLTSLWVDTDNEVLRDDITYFIEGRIEDYDWVVTDDI